VTALGSGDAFGALGRAGSCWLVRDALGAALVDCGPGVLQGLHRAGVLPSEVAAVHLTHLHGDHIAGWPFLLIDGVYREERSAPLTVTGPPGTAARLQTLFAACYESAAKKPLPFSLEVHELAPGEAREVDGRRVEALAAQHMSPPSVATSLRLHGPDGVLAFTGDTGPHAGLAGLAAGARALFCECSDLDAGPGAEQGGRKHLAWSELREILPGLGVRTVALSHLGAEARQARRRIEAEGEALGLDVTVCDDGTTLHLA
jgi:ribonuclease BN (tRNA processing enzyme)